MYTVKKQVATRKCDGAKFRFIDEGDGNVFVFAKGKKNRGWRYTEKEFSKNFIPVAPAKSEYAKRQDRMKKAIKKMETSGLWENVKVVYENLLTVPEDVYTEIERTPRNDIEDVATKYENDYPFLFAVNGSGEKIRNWDYFGELSECNTKSMYFGKVYNKSIKAEIKDAIANGEKYMSGRIRTNYDVSFEYNADKKCAWYSEEYKDCGNGHYYIAIDENTAIFYEND